jgi:hypothetical protein
MRKLTQAEALLRHLTNEPGATSLEITLATGCVNVTGRVSDLRAKGHTIECRKRQDGQDGYFIVPRRAAPVPTTGEQEPLW